VSEMKEIECVMKERDLGDGFTISGHLYEDIEEHDNCHVTVSKCENCGHITVGWYRMGSPPPIWVEPKDGDVGEAHRRTP
jgi:hypothetical protein